MQTETAIKVLKEVKNLFSDRDNWCSGQLLIKPNSYRNKPAYCLLGGLAKAKGLDDDEIVAVDSYDFALNSDGSGQLLFAAAHQWLAKKINEQTEIALNNRETTTYSGRQADPEKLRQALFAISEYTYHLAAIENPMDSYKINDTFGYDAVVEVLDLAIQIGETQLETINEADEVEDW